MAFWLVFFSASWAQGLFTFFRRMGALGLFILGVCDSSFLFLPFGNDFLLIALVTRSQASWQWMVYTLAATLGSLVGVLLVDVVMRKAGEAKLEKFVGPKQLEKLKQKLEKRGLGAVFLATLLPPPFPFTVLIVAASALQLSRRKMLIAVFAGRLLRFTTESLLALYFGRRLLRYLRSDYVEYFVYGLLVVAIIGSFFTLRKWLRTRPGQAGLMSS